MKTNKKTNTNTINNINVTKEDNYYYHSLRVAEERADIFNTDIDEKCIISKNNDFSLASEGNLKINNLNITMIIN